MLLPDSETVPLAMSPKTSEPSSSDGEVYAVGDELPPSTGEVLGSVEPHVFSNPRRASHWQQIYENAAYEGRHRFDASLTWSVDEEKKLRKRVATSHRNCTVKLLLTILSLTGG